MSRRKRKPRAGASINRVGGRVVRASKVKRIQRTFPVTTRYKSEQEENND